MKYLLFCPFWLLPFVCIFSIGPIYADETKSADKPTPPTIPTYVIHRTQTKITIDGRLDEADWQLAPSLGDFVFGYGLTKGEPTVCKILWDDDYLYFSYFLKDSHLVGVHTDRDGLIPADDSVEVYITPNVTNPKRHFAFYTNVRAALYDEQFDEKGTRLRKKEVTTTPKKIRKASWDSQGVLVAVTIDGTYDNDQDIDRSWSTEVAIPFKNFSSATNRLPPQPNDIWKLNPNRHAYMADRSCQYSQWAATIPTTGSFWGPELFGKVIFSAEPSAKR